MYRFLSQLFDPFTLLLLLVVCAVAMLWRRKSEDRRWLLLGTMALVVLVLISTPAVSYWAIGSLEWQTLPTGEMPDGAAIVVLGGGMLAADEVRPRATLAGGSMVRCFHAAQLYHQGPARPVIVSGGKVSAEPALAELMREFVSQLGVPGEDLLMEDQSRTTYENALYAATLLKQRNIHEIVLVTDATHLPRAVRCFQRQGLSVTPSGCNYRATRFDWSPRTFLPAADAAHDFSTAAHEWIGMLWYKLRGRI